MRPQASLHWLLAEDGLGPCSAPAPGLAFPHSWSGWGHRSPPGTERLRAARPFLGREDLGRSALALALSAEIGPLPRRCATPWGSLGVAQTPPTPNIPAESPALPLIGSPALEDVPFQVPGVALESDGRPGAGRRGARWTLGCPLVCRRLGRSQPSGPTRDEAEAVRGRATG